MSKEQLPNKYNSKIIKLSIVFGLMLSACGSATASSSSSQPEKQSASSPTTALAKKQSSTTSEKTTTTIASSPASYNPNIDFCSIPAITEAVQNIYVGQPMKCINQNVLGFDPQACNEAEWYNPNLGPADGSPNRVLLCVQNNDRTVNNTYGPPNPNLWQTEISNMSNPPFYETLSQTPIGQVLLSNGTGIIEQYQETGAETLYDGQLVTLADLSNGNPNIGTDLSVPLKLEESIIHSAFPSQ